MLTVEELDLSVRTKNCLINLGIKDIGELIQWSEKDLIRSSNFGSKSLSELKSLLDSFGLSFETKIIWPPENYEQLKREIIKIEPIKIQADQKSVMEKIKSILKKRETLIIKKRFWEGNTLEEIGSQQMVTRERIRQIEAKAMRKTKNILTNS